MISNNIMIVVHVGLWKTYRVHVTLARVKQKKKDTNIEYYKYTFEFMSFLMFH